MKPIDYLRTKWSEASDIADDNRGILSEVRLIGGGLVLMLVVTLVLTEVYAAIDVSSGPFANITTSLESTGVAAMSLLVVGFLVIAASAIMRYFGGGFGGGR